MSGKSHPALDSYRLIHSKSALLSTIAAMDFGSSYLPPEIVTNILRRLPNEDNKNVRLVSKGLSGVATCFLFETVYISTKLRDREVFTAVSEHPVFSQHVKEVVYESTNIVLAEDDKAFKPNRSSYTRFLNYHLNSRHLSGIRRKRYSKASIQRGFKDFKKAFDDQTELALYNYCDMTRHGDDFLRPANFSTLLMDPKSLQDVLRFLPDDLVRLVHGLPRMPRVKRFKITDFRYSKNKIYLKDNHVGGYMTHSRLSVSVKNEGVRGIDRVILNPRSWPSRNETADYFSWGQSWYRAFHILTQAASMTKMEMLESFHVDTEHGMSGLSHVVFAMFNFDRKHYHAMNAFSNLTIIQLKIQTAQSGGTHWQDTMARGGLARILGTAKHLKVLDLEMDVINRQPGHFENMIGNHTWPKLRKFKLANTWFASDRKGFLEFFERHRHTLRSLWLEQVMIVTEGEIRALIPYEMWSLYQARVPRSEKLTTGRWEEVLRAMASEPAALTEITFLENNLCFTTSGWVFHSCNPTTVFDFLRSSGEYRPAVPCQHRAQSVWFENARHSFAQ